MVLNSDKHMHLSKMVEFLHLIYNYLKSGIIYNSSIFIKMYVSKCMLVILLISINLRFRNTNLYRRGHHYQSFYRFLQHIERLFDFL